MTDFLFLFIICQAELLDREYAVKDLKYLQLLDCYGGLLTENQRELCEKYYMLDLSLSEIAEQKGVSRQNVSETLKKSRELLDFYEEKLRHNELTKKYSLEVSFMMTDVIKALDKFKQLHPEYSADMDEIIDMVVVGEKIDLDEEEN